MIVLFKCTNIEIEVFDFHCLSNFSHRMTNLNIKVKSYLKLIKQNSTRTILRLSKLVGMSL